MRRFLVLLKKELRELITLQALLPFVVVIVMFVALGQMLSTVTAEQPDTFPVAIADRDGGPIAEVVVTTLEQAGFVPTMVDGTVTGENVRALLDEAGANIIVDIPDGFSAAITAGEPQQLAVWTEIRSFSFVGNADIAALEGAIAAVNASVASAVAAQAAPGVPLQMLQTPVVPTEHVVIGDRSAEVPVLAVMAFVGQQTTLIPIVLFLVIIFASQMVATTIATEKENKTLETLLSYPVTRAAIVTSKMVAAALIALLSAGAYMLGMQQYMRGIETGLGASTGMPAAEASEAAMEALGLTFGPSDYALLGLTLFAGILVALSIAIILGAFAENVKSVQALLTPLMVFMLIPYFLTLFLDLSVLPDAVRIAVMAIPFTYPFITGPALFLGDYGTVWFGIAYQLVWFAVFVTIAARVFSSDRILTMKLSFGKKR